MADIGLLLVRVVIGLLFIGHGTQKLFGWFGGYGVKGTAGWFESIGIKPGVPMVVFVGLAELVGGLLFGAGLWLPVGSALIVIVMLGAIFKSNGAKGLWITQGGFEYDLVLLVVAVGIALTGAGAYSIDALLK